MLTNVTVTVGVLPSNDVKDVCDLSKQELIKLLKGFNGVVTDNYFIENFSFFPLAADGEGTMSST